MKMWRLALGWAAYTSDYDFAQADFMKLWVQSIDEKT